MNPQFKRGYITYTNSDNNVVIIAPHSGPAVEFSTARDDNSETVASLLFKKIKGKLIISNMPRNRIWGVDFNRDIPSLKTALTAYEKFLGKKDKRYLFDFRQKYAFVASNEDDYENRLTIYQNFWGEIIKGKYIILIHRSFPRVKSLPSIMDFVTFKDNGVKNGVIHEIVTSINEKYYNFLSDIDLAYKKMIMFEQERAVINNLKIYKTINPLRLQGEYKVSIEKDLEKIETYASKYYVEKLKDNFTPQNFLEACRSALDNSPTPQITIENVFDGSLAHGPNRKLFPAKGRIVLEAEPSRFLNFWYPKVTAEIIKDVLDRLIEINN